MKHSSLFWFILIIGAVACSPEKDPCLLQQQITAATSHTVAIGVVNENQKLKNTVDNNPQLQIYRVLDDDYMTGFHAKVIYKGLTIFSSNYMAIDGKIHKGFYTTGKIDETPQIDLNPKLKGTDAILLARKAIDFKGLCIQYQLGITETDQGYFLVWKVNTQEGYPTVTIDAQTGAIYYKDNGVRY